MKIGPPVFRRKFHLLPPTQFLKEITKIQDSDLLWLGFPTLFRFILTKKRPFPISLTTTIRISFDLFTTVTKMFQFTSVYSLFWGFPPDIQERIDMFPLPKNSFTPPCLFEKLKRPLLYST